MCKETGKIFVKRSGISVSVIKRLPRYYRFLGDLKTKGIECISSSDLARRMGVTASQIRQDLNCFGGFGQQGYGYNIEQLHKKIGEILCFGEEKKTILVGAGNIGRALAAHMDFEGKGYRLIGVFDKKPSLIGQIVSGIPIRNVSDLDEFCRENAPTVAILCIPREQTHDVARQLVSLGIKGFWNFTHYDLSVEYPDITVENVHLSDTLMTLSYNLAHNITHNSKETK